MTLFFYTLMGMVAVAFFKQPLFALSIYLHAMTFVFLGLFVAASAGEILFNKEEADILLHRPVDPRSLLWAKTRVLVEVSLWLAMAFNLAGLFVGTFGTFGSLRFPLVHITSTIMEALFCTSCVVVTYQLCLRWFGRERLDGLMTSAQVIVSIFAVLGGQLLPQVTMRTGNVLTPNAESWWMALIPPAWFAGLDDALAGRSAQTSWVLAGLAIAGTVGILAVAFGKLANDYERGLQNLQDTSTIRKPGRAGRRWIDRIANAPPLSWWLRDPVERASFILCTAYLTRDRDTKLRFYPGIAPMLVMPFIMLFQSSTRTGPGSEFSVAMFGSFIGLIPLIGIMTLQFSQQWQASDVFRAAPMRGPGALCAGARCAVFCFTTLPILIIFALVVWYMKSSAGPVTLILPGIIAMPVYSMVPNLGGRAVPLSSPTESAKAAKRGSIMIAVMLCSFILAGLSALFMKMGLFWWFILAETIVAAVICLLLRRSMATVRWESIE